MICWIKRKKIRLQIRQMLRKLGGAGGGGAASGGGGGVDYIKHIRKRRTDKTSCTPDENTSAKETVSPIYL